MPDLRPLNDLRARLAQALALPKVTKTQGWAPAHKPMGAALAQTVGDFGHEREARPADEAMVAAVRAFWRDRQVHSFNQLKYICYGLTLPVDADGTRLIDRAPLFKRVLELVDERQGQAKPFRRCYQGLLSGYFGFERRDQDAEAAQTNWLTLRGFLGDRIQAVQKATAGLVEPPLWFSTLMEHKNLLQDQPCARYAKALRRGDRAELQKVCTALNIEASSWVWHEAVLAYIVALVEDNDKSYKADLRASLELVQAHDKGQRLPDAIAKSAAALLVMRYAQCQDKPEHPTLRDACIERIGNPWLERAAWDGAVRDEEARRMVESWLKRGLIKDFFQLLSHEGTADARRLDYWLAWEPHITDMWFALGGAARREPQDTKLKELRARMRGRERALTGSTSGNTAFIMRIGQLQVVEFGEKGNACYVRDAAHYTGDLDEERQSIHALKQTLHSDGLRHDGPWESDFDSYLKQRLGALPARAKTTTDVRRAVTPKAQRTSSAKQIERPTASPSEPQPSGSSARGNWPEYTRPEDDPFVRRNAPARPPLKTPPPRPQLPIGWEREIRQLAAAEGLQPDDRRDRSGAFWLLKRDASPISGILRGRLDAMGFRWVVGKGFYLDTDD